MELSKIIVINIEGIDHIDYPDYCDAYISEAKWKDGTLLTSEELEELNTEYSEFVYECVIKKLF